MRTSLKWIESLVPGLDVTPQEYTDAMTMSGSKVEFYEEFDRDLDKIVVGRVEKIEKHPDSDHLVICQVNIGSERVQIVTGAPNVAEGQLVPTVLPGGRVAGGHDGSKTEGGIKIKEGRLRGVDSYGMMCSIEELGSTRDLFPEAPESGLYVFPAESGVQPGDDAIEALGLHDTAIEYEITSNRVDCFSHLRSRILSYRCVDFFKRLIKFNFHLRLADFYNNLIDEFNDFLDLFMCKKNCIKHIHFRNFFCACFYHHDSFLRSGNRHIDIGNFSLFKSRIDNKSSVHSADFYGSRRTVPRNVGNCDCDGRTDHCSDFRATVLVNRHAGCNNDNIIVEPLREQRPERSVHESGCQNRVFRRSSFSLNESSRNLSYRVHSLFKIAAEREEINSFLWLFGAAYGYVYNRVTVAHPSLSVCLLADLADFNLQKSSAERVLKCSVICKSRHFHPPVFSRSPDFV